MKNARWITSIFFLVFLSITACSQDGSSPSSSTSDPTVTNNTQPAATPAAPTPPPAVVSETSPVVWTPDYYGQKVQMRMGQDPKTKSVTLTLNACNPNSVAVNSDKLYVVCNKDAGNGDKILVYDAVAIRAAATGSVLNTLPEKTITSAEFSSLIGIAFDAQKDLWVASYGNNKVAHISTASLNTAVPVVDRSLTNSPDQPVALAFDPDGSLWVTGQYSGGILLNFTSDKLAVGGNVSPRYCFSNNAMGCQQQAGLFKYVEGVTLFNGQIWISNNGGATPGRELVAFSLAAGALKVDGVFGSQAAKTGPFLCPGGLFGTAKHLWVNDQGYGKADTTCGNTDAGSGVGAVLSFTPDLLKAQSADPAQIVRFTNITGRPGFGGIFVEAE